MARLTVPAIRSEIGSSSDELGRARAVHGENAPAPSGGGDRIEWSKFLTGRAKTRARAISIKPIVVRGRLSQANHAEIW
jgi:hypothetical protein